ncbi:MULTISPECIES: Cof-type HAD-IIB family hydrolase [Clostridium]|uniref:Cof-type HAD-IIB family hydrolase n=1 Tax=Clostridium aquiflavi TaxID=3073603 RepID=A0ABU1EJL5_9CLOT|nr:MULTISPECIES: Cof-type HAD-IIB family hydrolase [unclassified Clostridium]MDR5588588.1 Cof-type HAD-IIB family hydrolase [Clostridium sp. 5N-1]NFG60783.1 HAD family phosphatase [Clostridium botulinum]NFQ08217.1 HAD family phosphatase [Clostridium botulinum]
MKYKLVCIDMDGTLLNGHSNISERNKDALKKAVKKGVQVAISTGRIFASADYFADLIGIKTDLISCNGAYIKNRSTNEVMYSNTLTNEQVLKIHDSIKGHDFKIIYYTHDTAIVDSLFPENHTYNVTNKLVSDEKKVKFFITSDINKILEKYSNKIIKVICLDNSKDKNTLFEVKNNLLKFSDIETVSSGDNNFEVMQRGVSKGNAARILSEKLGIKQEEVICIGDNENDLSMIKFAGLGVAMGNGSDVVKEVADYITDTNVNDGVAKVIEKFIL